jgi:hypothetical protein
LQYFDTLHHHSHELKYFIETQLARPCHFLQGDMNHATEGDPTFWDWGDTLLEYIFVEINPKYWVALKPRREESAYRLSEKNMAEPNPSPTKKSCDEHNCPAKRNGFEG